MAISKNWRFFFFKMTVSFLIIFLLLKYNTIDLSKVNKAFEEPMVIFVLFLLLGIGLFFNSYRWMRILNIQKVEATYLPALRYSLIGIFFNFLLPSSVGGDVVKAIMAAGKWGHKKTKILLSAFIDRLFGLSLMISVSIVGFFINFEYLSEKPEIQKSIFILFCLLVLFALTFVVSHFFVKSNINSRIVEKIKPLLSELSKFFNNPSSLIVIIMMSVGSTLAHILFFHLAFTIINIDIPFSTLMFCVPIGTLLTALPIAPAGIGVGQAVFFYMFNIFGEGLGEGAFFAVTLLQIIYFAWGVIGAFCFSLTPVKMSKLKEVHSD